MREVLADHASGMTFAEIGKKRYQTDRTVQRIAKSAQIRLGANNYPQAVLIAHYYGYISLPDERGNCAASPSFGSDS